MVEREEVVTMGQEMVPDGDLDRALGMGRLVAPPVQFTLVEAVREGVVEEDKMVGPGMVQDPVLATARLVVMGLAVAHTLRREGKVEAEVAAVGLERTKIRPHVWRRDKKESPISRSRLYSLVNR